MLPDAKKLPDNAQWENRFEIRSGSSNRVYVVSQNRKGRHWACSCPGWKSHRKCKHLTACGLPCHEEPFEVAKPKKGFTDGYKTYDDSCGHGGAGEWNQSFRGRMGLDEALRTLRIDGMPSSFEEAQRVYRDMLNQRADACVADYEEAVAGLDLSLTAEQLQAQAERVQHLRTRAEVMLSWMDAQRMEIQSRLSGIGKKLMARSASMFTLDDEAPEPAAALTEAFSVIAKSLSDS